MNWNENTYVVYSNNISIIARGKDQPDKIVNICIIIF